MQGSHRLGKIKFPDFSLTYPDNFKVIPGILQSSLQPVFSNDFKDLADIYWAGSLTPDILFTQEISVIMNGPKFKLIQFTYYMQRSTHR